MAKVFGILFAHSDLPKAYKGVLRSIWGKIPDFAFLSNTGLSAADMEKKLLKKVARIKDKDIIIFVDIIGSSCWQASLRIKERFKNIAVFSGFNLPLLVKFLQYRDKIDFPSLLSLLIKTGREAIKISGVPGDRT
jgi:mannose/fructose-specific phosphotransferase system component IIA|uniref:PTS EIIA type-4 domain-containing protein n=1 Tax=candidate division WOR-3 bacterium TaxID=2052148 RepID=A0A7C3UNU9_UNCW3